MPKNFISITTKTGDAGVSSLANGARLAKSDLVFAALGDFDELNSWLGLLISKLKLSAAANISETALIINQQIRLIELTQAWIYEASAILAKSPGFKMQINPLIELEAQTNSLQLQLGENWHTRFLYPGGSELAGWLDIVRTVARRTERGLVAWMQQPEADVPGVVTKTVLPTFNRLSDYLYILRCWINDKSQVVEKQFGQAKNH